MSVRVGFDLGGTKIEILALDLEGRERLRRRVATPRGDYDATIAAMAALLRDAESALGTTARSIGVGIPGTESPSSGLVKNANSTWLIGRPLRADLERAFGQPVRLANDANCFAVSEAADGAAAGAPVVFGVILGTGVGGGIVVNGRPVIGANAIAGEWGHNPLPWPEGDERPGPPCYCGQSGCIESFLSGPALSAQAGDGLGRSMSAEELDAAASAGEAAAERLLMRYQQRLSRALASVINVLDPDVIVLGGGLSKMDRLYDTVPSLWGDWVFSDRVATRLVKHAHGDSSGVRGAAWLWSEDVRPGAL